MEGLAVATDFRWEDGMSSGYKSFLLIPDGFRRSARSRGTHLQVEYRRGAAKVPSDLLGLYEHYDLAGVFVMAKYNLQRPDDERSALLEGVLEGLYLLVDRLHNDHRIVVIGDTDSLILADSRFQDAIQRCVANPQVHAGRASVPRHGDCWIYLCYDDDKYIREVYSSGPAVTGTHSARSALYPHWSHAFRTGCKAGLFRWSATFPGTAQTLAACTERLYCDTALRDMLARFDACRVHVE